MTDYATLIDAETWAFIDKTNSFYPPDTIDYTIEQQRAVYDRMCHAFFAGYPADVVAETTAIQASGRDIPVRIYRRAETDAAAMVLYFHGGGFILGGLDSHDDVCADLCHRTGFDVASVDYRLAPEHRHPAAYDDAMAALEWAAATWGRPIVISGDSAGGNLASAVCHAVRGKPHAPIGQVLIYPGLGGERTWPSYVEHAEAPMLTVRDLDFYRDIRTGGIEPADPVTLYPLQESHFSGLPPTVAITAQCDPLSSDGEVYRDRILAAGGRAFWHEEPGLVHGYLRARNSVARARASFTRIADAIAMLGYKRWDY
jgi:acetyl esterase